MLCEYCGRIIIGKVENNKQLVNVCQRPDIRNFCSKECKDNWCYSVHNNKKRSVIAWTLGAYLNKYFFVKKIINVGPSLPLFSHFSKNLDHIEKLKLIKIGDSRILTVCHPLKQSVDCFDFPLNMRGPLKRKRIIKTKRLF
jgi:hypothetical protein